MRRIILVLILSVIILVYAPWFFSSGTLSSGDWPYLFTETIQSFSFIPKSEFLWLGPYYQVTSKISAEYFHMHWEMIERLWWFWMFVVLSCISSWYLSKRILKETKFIFLAVLIFLTNSYILMIVGGGQMGIALSYAFVPFVFGSYIDMLRKFSIKKSFIASLFLALHIMFDLRIAYITCFALLVYSFMLFFGQKDKKKYGVSSLIFLAMSSCTIFLINAPWIIARFFHPLVETSIVDSPMSLKFFSFGSFSFALSLLHPNWPENIFGKTYFLQPEFLLLPILAYTSLLFIDKQEKRRKDILSFALIGLVGVFFAKGIQEPLGSVYEWMFFHVPGFLFFRDPTKFYFLIVLSYAILIPFTLEKIADKISVWIKWKQMQNATILIFLMFWLFLIHPVFLGKLSGTFKPRSVPVAYISLKNFLINDSSYAKTLWVPSRTTFSFYSERHPLLESTTFLQYTSPAATLSVFLADTTKKKLQENNIKYVIVPDDVEQKIFLYDRKYSEEAYQKIVRSMQRIPYLTQTASFRKIMVFQVRE